jgi:hypothetical protein
VNRAVPNPLSSVKALPHWRVNLRPDDYEPELIPSLAECWALVQRTKLSLRGWDYPHIDFPENQELGASWIGTWSDFHGHQEYWRLYQSGQFIHFFTVREVTEPGWQEKLKASAGMLGSAQETAALSFMSITNFLWSVTEIFEFAARLVQGGLYPESVRVSIRLDKIAQFALTETGRPIHNLYRNTSETLEKSWQVGSADLLARSSEYALVATGWFFERFGWLSPPIPSLREEQEKLLKGRF